MSPGRIVNPVASKVSPEIEARLLTMGLEGAMLVARSYGEPRRFEEIDLARKTVFGDDPAIVGVNANSGNPHYSPSAATAKPIRAAL